MASRKSRKVCVHVKILDNSLSKWGDKSNEVYTAVKKKDGPDVFPIGAVLVAAKCGEKKKSGHLVAQLVLTCTTKPTKDCHVNK